MTKKEFFKTFGGVEIKVKMNTKVTKAVNKFIQKVERAQKATKKSKLRF